MNTGTDNETTQMFEEFRQAGKRLAAVARAGVNTPPGATQLTEGAHALPWKPVGRLAINVVRYSLGALIFICAVVPFKIFAALVALDPNGVDEKEDEDEADLWMTAESDDGAPNGNVYLDPMTDEFYTTPVAGSITTDGRTVGVDGRLY